MLGIIKLKEGLKGLCWNLNEFGSLGVFDYKIVNIWCWNEVYFFRGNLKDRGEFMRI